MLAYFDDELHYIFLLEYAENSDLRHELLTVKRFPEKRVAAYVYKLADALKYCHDNLVIHRDVKPENILIGSNDEPKIGDFGSCVHTEGVRRMTLCGTKPYMAPERIAGKSYDETVDLWSLGVVVYEIVCGKHPFQYKLDTVIEIKIDTVDYDSPVLAPEGAQDIIKKLLQKDPKSRLPLRDLQEHPWVRKNHEVTPQASAF